MTVTSSGEPNLPSAVLFIIALTMAGLGLVVFFLASTRFFRQVRVARALSWLGSAFGVISGLAYIAIAFTPANLLIEPHYHAVLAAFRAFLAVVVFYTAAIFVHKGYPRIYGAAYLLFAVLLAAYLWLLTQGPGLETTQGAVIQAVGQKLIVYAAIICTGFQSYGALRQVSLAERST